MKKEICGDFHVHTFLSDGSSRPEEIFIGAQKAGLSHVAITDHDVLPSVTQYSDYQSEYDITNFRAVEISSMDIKRHRRVHILCYLPIVTSEIEKICNQTVINRMNAGLEMAEMVSKKYSVTVDEIKEVAKNSKSIFKQHIMKALISKNITDRIYGNVYQSLFGGATADCLVDCVQPNVFDVISAVKQSGGICVMAHPHTYKGIDFLKEGLAQGLFDGVEVWSGKTTVKQETELLNILEKYNVIKTGGTDFHGENAERVHNIGYKRTPEKSICEILSLNEKRKRERQ